MAAVSVVLHHIFRAIFINSADGAANPVQGAPAVFIEMLSTGVDLFFILSGFLMVYISDSYLSGKNSKSDFMIQRIIRIWPNYAVVTSLILLFAVLRSKSLDLFELQPIRLLSYLFIPSFNKNGLVQPILGVGWTLNYEIFFYLVFTASLFLFRERLLLGLGLLIGLAIIIGNSVGGRFALTEFMQNTIMIEFLFGGLIASFYKRCRVSGFVAAGVMGTGLVLLILLSPFCDDNVYRFIARGVPCSLLFYGLIQIEHKYEWPRFLVFLGDASYSIYLVHVPVIYGVLPKLQQLFLKNGLVQYWNVAGILILFTVSISIGLIFYIIVERNLVSIFQGLYNRYKLRSAVASKI